MKKTIRIKTKFFNYTIEIGNKIFYKNLSSLKNKDTKNFIIIDTKVYNKFKRYFKSIENKKMHILKINGSEKIKTIESYWKIIIKLIELKIDRSSQIIAIGGGTIGDLVGFVASTILRGIDFILIPTTLLSQVDSSIGGKNGINSKFGKNQIGTFYQPSKVIIDPLFLKSLPLNELRSGYAEIFKHALISDKKFYYWLKKNHNKVLSLNNKELVYAIEKSIKIKNKFVVRDEKEKLTSSNSRAMLNFGHTFGHALESLNNYKKNINHGQAISIGMVVAAKISNKLNGLKRSEVDDIIQHLKECGLPINSHLLNNKKIFNKISSDKKNSKDKINLILLKNIGKAYYKRNLSLNFLKKNTIY